MKRWYILAPVCLVLLTAGLLFAYSGPLQRGLDHWVAGRMKEALSDFRMHEQGSQGELATLNRVIAEGELLRNQFVTHDVEGRSGLSLRQTLLRLGDELAALDLDPSLRHVGLYHAGRFALEAGDRDLGLRRLQAAYRSKPGLQYLANPLLDELMKGPDVKLLRETARHQLSVRPDNAHAWYALGQADIREGFPGRALRSWKRGIDTVPLLPMLQEAISLSLEQGDEEQALIWLEQLRFRYGHCFSVAGLDSFCTTLGRMDLLEKLPPDRIPEQEDRHFHEFFPMDREWIYKVRYGFIPLGQLLVGVSEKLELVRADGKRVPAYRVYYKIDSNPLYRILIDLHDHYEAVIPAHCLHCEEFITFSRSGDERYDRIYTFDVEQMDMVARGYHVEGDIYFMHLPIARQLFDGLSLLFAARRQVKEQNFGPVLTMVDEEVHSTVIESDGRDRIRIMNRPQRVLKVHGSADYDGIAGLTGEFWGSFTDDREVLPVAARFQIGVGKISLKLEEIHERP